LCFRRVLPPTSRGSPVLVKLLLGLELAPARDEVVDGRDRPDVLPGSRGSPPTRQPPGLVSKDDHVLDPLRNGWVELVEDQNSDVLPVFAKGSQHSTELELGPQEPSIPGVKGDCVIQPPGILAPRAFDIHGPIAVAESGTAEL